MTTLVERLRDQSWGPNVADTLSQWSRDRESAAARIEELEQALRPFAQAATDREQMLRDGGYKLPPDDAPAGYEQRHGGYVQMTPLWRELRRARSALGAS